MSVLALRLVSSWVGTDMMSLPDQSVGSARGRSSSRGGDEGRTRGSCGTPWAPPWTRAQPRSRQQDQLCKDDEQCRSTGPHLNVAHGCVDDDLAVRRRLIDVLRRAARRASSEVSDCWTRAAGSDRVARRTRLDMLPRPAFADRSGGRSFAQSQRRRRRSKVGPAVTSARTSARALRTAAAAPGSLPPDSHLASIHLVHPCLSAVSSASSSQTCSTATLLRLRRPYRRVRVPAQPRPRSSRRSRRRRRSRLSLLCLARLRSMSPN
jgi:hypothetical protein